MAACCVAIALTGAAWPQASTDPVPEIQRLLQSGDGARALERIDAALARSPDDAAMRFRRGVALSLLGRESEAEAVFKRLSEEHPEMPASYNNLAVLYSRRGDLHQARDALEKATQAYPGYGAAYANLGDVYAQLASQAYSKALGLDTPDPSLADKLTRLQGVLSEAGPTAGAKPLKAPGTATTVAAAATATGMATATPAVTPAVTPAATAPATASTRASAPAPAAAPTTRPTPSAAAPGGAGAGDVAAAVAAWAAAWGRRDMDAYVAAYTEDFAGAAPSHAVWVQERRARILARRHIDVRVAALRVDVHGDHAVARFRQTYRSDNVDETVAKTLKLVRRDAGRWLIEQETTGE